MATLKISGPARQLLRVREQEATLRHVEGEFVAAGDAIAVNVTLESAEDGRRLRIRLDREAWDEMRARIDKAWVFVDLPGQMRLL